MKKCTAVLMILIMIFSAIPCSAINIIEKSTALYELGLLKGNGGEFDTAMLELNRPATRTEMCITVVRMLGKEEKALYQKNPHPFYDVPDWASDYIGWLYENYLVNGNTDTYFGAEETATIQQFSTMLMRVLGYSDKKGDFSYNSATEFAKQKGVILYGSSGSDDMLRSGMFDMCYNALTVNIKNSSRTLVEKLCEDYAIDSSVATRLNLLKEKTITESFVSLEETLGKITVSFSGTRHIITFKKDVEHYGLRVYVMEKGTGVVKAVSLRNNDPVYMEKGKIKYNNYDPAGYVSELYVYGLDKTKKYEFIVIKTTSEGDSYLTVGKSGVGEVK